MSGDYTLKFAQDSEFVKAKFTDAHFEDFTYKSASSTAGYMLFDDINEKTSSGGVNTDSEDVVRFLADVAALTQDTRLQEKIQ